MANMVDEFYTVDDNGIGYVYITYKKFSEQKLKHPLWIFKTYDEAVAEWSR